MLFYIFLFLFLVFDAYLTILLRNRVYNRTSLLKMIDELSLIDELVGIIVNRGISFGEALRVIRDITSRDSLFYILHYISRNLNVDLVPEEDMRDIFGDVIELPHIKNEVGGPTHKLNPGYLRESLIERLGRKITELESKIEGAEDVASIYNFIVCLLYVADYIKHHSQNFLIRNLRPLNHEIPAYKPCKKDIIKASTDNNSYSENLIWLNSTIKFS